MYERKKCMDRNDKWNKFMMTGSVRDYLLFKGYGKKEVCNVHDDLLDNVSGGLNNFDNNLNMTTNEEQESKI